MFKHANTFVPGARVRIMVGPAAKVASAQNAGRVVDADVDTSRVKVATDAGEELWIAMVDVVKEP